MEKPMRRYFLLPLAVPMLVAFVFVLPIEAQAAKFKVLHTFAGGNDGEAPTAPPTLDRAGNVYGTTAEAGNGTGCTNGCGTVFQLQPSGAQYRERILYSFSDPSGSPIYSNGPLVLDANGKLYGTSAQGGDLSCNCGFVYELVRSHTGWTENVIHTFLGSNAADGSNPYSGVVHDKAGNLYGTTNDGGNSGTQWGTVFELTPNTDGTWTETIIYGFPTYTQGIFPYALTIDAKGNLYVTASQGGVYGNGTIIKLALSGGVWTETTLYAFTGGDNGSFPFTGAVPDVAGNLYGTTSSGGDDTVGNVFKLTPAKGYWNFSTVYNFTGGRDGGLPNNTLTMDQAGDLYGTTQTGGAYQYGTVYNLALSSGKWVETVLHSFTGGSDGAYPVGIVLDSSGNLFGTANSGGAHNFGTVFEITP
jgi:uncharacterized repeat protein (TIGR03803 family)